MSREWKSGDVAMVSVRGADPVVALRDTHGWAHSTRGIRGEHAHWTTASEVDPIRPLVVIDPEAVLPGWNAENIPALLEGCAQIVAESTAPREVHETTLLLNLVQVFDEALGTGLSEPSDPTARVTDRRDNIWRLLADGEWVCTSGPDIGEYLAWSRLAAERGPVEVMES